ncbi:type IV secretion protein Rhs, partial [Bacillus thuringiensis serovar israelensis]
YDPINQLLNEALPNGTTKSYTYDGFGNRTSVKVVENGKETKSIAATFNEGNQLVKFGNESLTYDANGNRTSDGKYKYTWNEDDQLVAITKQGESNAFATYKYDEDNRRIEKSVNGQVTRYFYDGDSINPLYETDGSGNVLRQYVYSTSGARLAMKSKGQTLYYHYNPRGDVIAMTDQNREVVATYEYDSWGNVLKSDTKGIATENPFGYAGYMYDKEIGMYYLIARYYNPDHAVFLSVDPDPGDEDDPVTMNGYTYVDNNPVMLIDPDGNIPVAPLVIAGARMAAPHIARYAAKQAAKQAARKAKKRATLAANKRAGARAEELAKSALKKKGYDVLGSQVSVRTSKGIRRVDHLVRTPRGKLLAVEVKAGNARRTAMQLKKDKLMRKQGGKIIGKNAPRRLKDQVRKIRTVVVTPK